jgi:hypothetical protein
MQHVTAEMSIVTVKTPMRIIEKVDFQDINRDAYRGLKSHQTVEAPMRIIGGDRIFSMFVLVIVLVVVRLMCLCVGL